MFIQNSGNLVVAALTRREYLTSVVHTKTLLDGQWHYVTVAITPPKRPFSYSQINVYIDFMQKLSATLKVQAINEVILFTFRLYCFLLNVSILLLLNFSPSTSAQSGLLHCHSVVIKSNSIQPVLLARHYRVHHHKSREVLTRVCCPACSSAHCPLM